jgi:hypothetical protein
MAAAFPYQFIVIVVFKVLLTVKFSKLMPVMQCGIGQRAQEIFSELNNK